MSDFCFVDLQGQATGVISSIKTVPEMDIPDNVIFFTFVPDMPAAGIDRAGQMKICHACLKVLEIKTPVGRQESCVFCGSDLHCCLNCTFYAKSAYNDCREPQAERVIEKGKSNFCDYFVFRDAASGLKEKTAKESAKTKLESLFKRD